MCTLLGATERERESKQENPEKMEWLRCKAWYLIWIFNLIYITFNDFEATWSQVQTTYQAYLTWKSLPQHILLFYTMCNQLYAFVRMHNEHILSQFNNPQWFFVHEYVFCVCVCVWICCMYMSANFHINSQFNNLIIMLMSFDAKKYMPIYNQKNEK